MHIFDAATGLGGIIIRQSCSTTVRAEHATCHMHHCAAVGAVFLDLCMFSSCCDVHYMSLTVEAEMPGKIMRFPTLATIVGCRVNLSRWLVLKIRSLSTLSIRRSEGNHASGLTFMKTKKRNLVAISILKISPTCIYFPRSKGYVLQQLSLVHGLCI